MARLNEPQVPTESLESLKRRCIRQNREIAKINSTQSLRIRNLEAETSRLLSENIALREQNIKLQCEVERRSTRNTLHNVGLVKGKLEAKLAELGSLVVELGEIQSRRRTSHRPSGGHSENLATKRSPDQRNWKNALTLSEVTAGQDGRLPPILEDKLYPRRTLDADKILGIISDPTNIVDSPDLGPPIARYELNGDPMKHDHSSNLSGSTEGIGLPITSAFSNLETRKKRRALDATLSSNINHEDGIALADNILPSSQGSRNATPGQSFKSGAKRKLNVREDDDHRESQSMEKDSFHFNRCNESQTQVVSEPAISNEGSQNTSDDLINSETRLMTSGPERNKPPEQSSNHLRIRRALGEKSVNDPISPVKSSKAGWGLKATEPKDETAKKPRERDQNREKPTVTKVVRIPDRTKAPKLVTIESSMSTVEPIFITPAQPECDVFLPTPIQTPALSIESRDTPPPSDITGRTSRRSRGNVSYAEPSLRDKMRRPTKELVDAVGVDERIQRAVSTKLENEDDDVVFERVTEKTKSKDIVVEDIVVKKEDSTNELTTWKSLPIVQSFETESSDPAPEPPGSPFSSKSSSVASVGNLPASVMTDRKRRASTLPSANEENVSKAEAHPQAPPTSGSNDAIAALVAGNHKRTSRILNPSTAESVTKARKDKMTDPLEMRNRLDANEEGASPPTSTDVKERTTTAKVPSASTSIKEGGTGTTRLSSSKRYSSVPEGLSSNSRAGGGGSGTGETNGASNGPTTHRPPSSRGGSRRRDTTVLESSASAPSLGIGSEKGNSGGGKMAAETARMERLAGRRRSMIL